MPVDSGAHRASLSQHRMAGFLSAFCPMEDKMRLYRLLEGGKYVSMCKTCGMLSWEILILDLLLDAIWWNLELFSHKHNLPRIVSLKLYN